MEAFDRIYDKYSGKLYAFGLKYLRSTAEAEELVQSVFLKLWENYKNLKKKSSLKSYLFTIAYNDICKLFRKRNYRQYFIDDTLYENSHSSSETEDGIDYQSVLERVQQIVDKLPERQKTIFLKSRQEGKSTKDFTEDVLMELDHKGDLVSMTIEHASRKANMSDFSFNQINQPFKTAMV